MKKTIRLLLVLSAILILAQSACYAKTVKHNMASTSITVGNGDKITLSASGIKAKNIVWKSSDKSIVSVNKKGKATAKDIGEATITAKYQKIKFTVSITVSEETPQAEEPTPTGTDKIYNKLVYSDDCLDIYLYRVLDGKLFLKFTNKDNESYLPKLQYIEMNGETYEPYSYAETVPANFTIIYELALSKIGDNSEYEHRFTNDKLKVYLTYLNKNLRDIGVSFNIEL